MEPFIGQIQIFGFNFAPRGWALCDGQLLPISQNTALFSLLGTTYGGDGRTTFALPDLRGRVPVHVGNGPGLDTISWGEKGGQIQSQLTVANLPSHSHALNGTNGTADQAQPGGNALAQSSEDQYAAAAPGDAMRAGSVGNTGGNQAFNIRNPYLGIYYSIALQGIFPSRN